MRRGRCREPSWKRENARRGINSRTWTRTGASRRARPRTHRGNYRPAAGLAPVPGQYHDAETDLFENWNRYYDPSIGRYLQPEPMLEEPRFVKTEAARGRGVPAYAYASNNPIRYTDPQGLWTKDDSCKNVPTEDDVRARAAQISDECLRECVMRKIEDAHLSCSVFTQIRCNEEPATGAFASLGQCREPRWWQFWVDDPTIVGWCSRPVNRDCQIGAAVHEFAHLCGWDHEYGKNVPGEGGKMECDRN